MKKENVIECPFCKSTYTKYLKQKDRFWCFDCNKYFTNNHMEDAMKATMLIPVKNIEFYVEVKEQCPNCKSTHVRFSTRSMKYWCYECNMYF